MDLKDDQNLAVIVAATTSQVAVNLVVASLLVDVQQTCLKRNVQPVTRIVCCRFDQMQKSRSTVVTVLLKRMQTTLEMMVDDMGEREVIIQKRHDQNGHLDMIDQLSQTTS
jgi:hypothetical protein